MGKQHNTIPNEPQEIPERKGESEIKQASDPNLPEIPLEDPDCIPNEIPSEKHPEKQAKLF